YVSEPYKGERSGSAKALKGDPEIDLATARRGKMAVLRASGLSVRLRQERPDKKSMGAPQLGGL
ncbi:MAG TPA: hypothetical protein PK585_06185, partial [Amphiplicatus sp.]|nr:hypothetical protein [Amphiplicatus sp.]